MVPSEKLELHRDLVARGDSGAAPDLLLYRQKLAAAVQREDRGAPRPLADRRFHLDRAKSARASEGVGFDLGRLVFRHGQEIPSTRGFALPDPQERGERDHGFFCQSYCGRRRPAALTSISSRRRLSLVSGLFALVIQWSADLR